MEDLKIAKQLESVLRCTAERSTISAVCDSQKWCKRGSGAEQNPTVCGKQWFEPGVGNIFAIVAIGKPERHVRKASHCGSNKQQQRSCAAIALSLLVRATYKWCYSSRTSRSWWITHSTQSHRRGERLQHYHGPHELWNSKSSTWSFKKLNIYRHEWSTHIILRTLEPFYDGIDKTGGKNPNPFKPSRSSNCGLIGWTNCNLVNIPGLVQLGH